MPPAFPTLATSYKGRYAFRLACPSFVYPADYTVNVARLGPYVDEIELLCLESAPASRPDASLVTKLINLGREHSLSYNVHLPIDARIGDASVDVRRHAMAAVRQVICATRSLQPACWVLHIHPGPDSAAAAEVARWQTRVSEVLTALVAEADDSRRLAVENLNYPFAWVRPLIQAHDLGICVDVGHAFLAREPVTDLFSIEAPRIAMVHIHGVRDGRDHRPLADLPSSTACLLKGFLRGYRGVVVVEVFDFNGLQSSLALLEEWISPSSSPPAAIGR